MRNVFDQYDQPENRLTHGLMVALSNERKLIRPFLKQFKVKSVPVLKNIQVGLQQVPGEAAEYEKEGKDGLPDGCFFDEGTWAVLLECKVAAGVSVSQLRRHRKTAERHGYDKPCVVLITSDNRRKKLPGFVHHILWSDVYQWFRKYRDSHVWAKYFLDYMHVFEARMVSKDYSYKGTLTMFDGFRFSKDTPYTYREGKRLIRLMGEEFRKNKRLMKELGLDTKAPGRSAITRGENGAVWDLLVSKKSGKVVTSYPHATMVIRPDKSYAALTVPNAYGAYKTILKKQDKEEFRKLIAEVEKRLRKTGKKVKGMQPMFYLIQRHYKSQRSNPVTDGRIEVDLRAMVRTNAQKVKYQPMWIESIYKILTSKKSNIQWGIEVRFPHSAKVMQSRKALEVMADAWIAMKPVMEFVKR